MDCVNDIILTVVIANYNYGRFLPNALESIIRQCGVPEQLNGILVLPISGTDQFVEVIICDAESQDDSVDVIKRYSKYLAWWCSEKDNGQSSAFNKGFSRAHGRWLTWLNADEEYMPGTFRALVKKIAKQPRAKWITSNELRFDVETRKITYVAWGPHTQPRIFSGNHACIAVFGPSSFIRTDIYKRIGKINEEFHYSMDLEYWTRLTLAGIRQTRLNRLTWAFGVHADSISLGNMTPEKIKRGHAENVARSTILGYNYEISFRNPWYVLWMLWRVIDGSIFVRLFKKWTITGKCFNGSNAAK